MCVKTELWALPLSDALLLPVSMATAARRLRNGIFNHLLCLQMYLITDHTHSSASSHMGTEAAASRVPPSPPGLQRNWPCPEIWGIWSKGDGEGERAFAKLWLQPLLLLWIQVGTVQRCTQTVSNCHTSTMGWPARSSSCCSRSCRSWFAWKEPLEQLHTTSVLPGTMSPFLLDLQDPWVWEDALTASSCTFKQLSSGRGGGGGHRRQLSF